MLVSADWYLISMVLQLFKSIFCQNVFLLSDIGADILLSCSTGLLLQKLHTNELFFFKRRFLFLLVLTAYSLVCFFYQPLRLLRAKVDLVVSHLFSQQYKTHCCSIYSALKNRKMANFDILVVQSSKYWALLFDDWLQRLLQNVLVIDYLLLLCLEISVSM